MARTTALGPKTTRTRKKLNATASSSSTGFVTTAIIVDRVRELFPDIDPGFLAEIIPQYGGTPTEIVSRIAHKLLHIPYPTVLCLPSGAVDTRRSMNRDLIILHEVFPRVEVSLLRQTLHRFSFAWALLTAEAILERPPARVVDGPPPVLDKADLVRPFSYLNRLSQHLSDTYPSLPASTLKTFAVENRYELAPTLSACDAEMQRRKWFGKFWGSVRRVFSPDLQLADASSYPVSEDDAHAGDDEWRREWRIFKLEEVTRAETEHLRLAKILNEDQYTAEGQLIECGCCFGDFTFEEIDSCTAGHVFCKSCISNHVTTFLFGQGTSPKAFPCMSISDACGGHFSETILRRVLPPKVFSNYERTLNERVAASFEGDPIFSPLKCPFCPYTEFVEAPHLDTWWSPSPRSMHRTHPLHPVRRAANSMFLVLFHATYFILLTIHPHFIPEASVGPTAGFLFPLVDPPGAIRVISKHIYSLFTGAKRDRNVLYCRNYPEPSPDPSLPPSGDPSKCGRRSCLACSKEWEGPDHQCHTDADDLRLYVERAMAEAVKRTCPNCRTSFVKSDGCNKMRCACGYQMCYVCREDVSKTGYSHFCQHFRVLPGTTCRECNKCDLWKVENEEAAVRAAAQRARETWVRGRSSAEEPSVSVPVKDALVQVVGPSSSFQLLTNDVRKLMDALVVLLLG